MITKHVIYKFDGEEYPSFDRAVDAVENKIYSHIEKALKDTDVRHSQKGKVMEYILQNKEELVRLLSVDTRVLDAGDEE